MMRPLTSTGESCAGTTLSSFCFAPTASACSTTPVWGSYNARNVRKFHPQLYEHLRCIARVVMEKSSQKIPPLHWPLPWLVVR